MCLAFFTQPALHYELLGRFQDKFAKRERGGASEKGAESGSASVAVECLSPFTAETRKAGGGFLSAMLESAFDNKETESRAEAERRRWKIQEIRFEKLLAEGSLTAASAAAAACLSSDYKTEKEKEKITITSPEEKEAVSKKASSAQGPDGLVARRSSPLVRVDVESEGEDASDEELRSCLSPEELAAKKEVSAFSSGFVLSLAWHPLFFG